MKSIIQGVAIFSGFVFLSVPFSSALASTTVTVESQGETVTTVVPTESTEAITTAATPVVIEQTGNPKQFEGEIIRVDYPKSLIVVRDTFGRERKVIVKQGMINNYKVSDYVEVEMMADLKEAKMIHTVRDLPRFDGMIVRIDPSVNQIVIREHNGRDRTVVVAPDMIAQFKAKDKVRVYGIGDRQAVRWIYVI